MKKKSLSVCVCVRVQVCVRVRLCVCMYAHHQQLVIANVTLRLVEN